MDRFEESAAHGRRGLAVARATGQGELVPMLTQASATALCVQGRFREAAELLDGAIEASRLAGNDQTLAWDLMNRGVRRRAPRRARARRSRPPRRACELTRDLGDGFVSTHAGVMLAIARLENGERGQGGRAVRGAGGGEAMPLLPGGWRAKYLELLTRGWLRSGRRDEAGRAAAYAADGRRRDRPAAWRRPGRSAPRPRSRSSAGDAGAARRARARLGRARPSRRRPGRGRASRARSPGGRSRAPASATRAVAELQARDRRVRGARRAALPRSRPSASCASSDTAVPRRSRAGQARRARRRLAQRARARARAARGRPQDESRDRRRAVPQPEDRRVAPAQHLPQARRRVPRRARARRRARRARGGSDAERALSRGTAGRAPARTNSPVESRLAVLVADDQQRALDRDVARRRVGRRPGQQLDVLERLERLARAPRRRSCRRSRCPSRSSGRASSRAAGTSRRPPPRRSSSRTSRRTR